MSVKEPLWRQLKAEVAEDFSLLSLKEFHENSSLCYLVTGEMLGAGDAEIGRNLMVDYFTTMANQRFYPAYIVLMNEAVKLLLKESPLYAVFMEMENNGTAVFASLPSIEFYQITDKIDPLFPAATGRLLQIVHGVDKVITL